MIFGGSYILPPKIVLDIFYACRAITAGVCGTVVNQDTSLFAFLQGLFCVCCTTRRKGLTLCADNVYVFV